MARDGLPLTPELKEQALKNLWRSNHQMVWKCEICEEDYRPDSPKSRWCKTCIPNHQAWHRFKVHGVSDPQWKEIVNRYNGKCWICKKPPRNNSLQLDHSHGTGKVRGALCVGCNTRLHHVEDADWLDAAQTYLIEND